MVYKFLTSIRSDVHSWSKISAQISARSLLEIVPWIFSLAFVGKGLGSKYLAALSLAEAWGFFFLSAFWSGIYDTASTFISQSHGGKEDAECRGWLILSAVLISLLNCIIAMAWYWSESILLRIGFDEELVKLGASFLVDAIPSLFMYGIAIVINAYLTAVQIAWLPPILEIITCIVSTIASYTFIFGFDGFPAMGLGGAAMGWNVGAIFCMLQYICALWFIWCREKDYASQVGGNDIDREISNDLGLEKVEAQVSLLDSSEITDEVCSQSSGDFEIFPSQSCVIKGPLAAQLEIVTVSSTSEFVAALKFARNYVRWKQFLAPSLSNCITSALQEGQYAFLSGLAAHMGGVQIAAHNTMLCLMELANVVTRGMGEATLVQTGYYLGRRDEQSAQRVVYIGLAGAVAWGLAAGGIGIAFSDDIVKILTDDPDVLAIAAKVSPLLWSSYVLLAISMQVLGILAGSCRAGQKFAIFTLGVWLVGIPAAGGSTLYPQLGLRGLWGGLLVGYAVIAAVGTWVVLRSDWHKLALEAEAVRARDDCDI